MTNFAHLSIPQERHPSAQAREHLSEKLRFDDHSEIQDWERHFADENRIEEFLVLYVLGDLSDDEKFLLMGLILASAAFAEKYALSDQLWQQIESWLIDDICIHRFSIWDWADIDEETGYADNSYQISQRMQALLQRDFVSQDLTGASTKRGRDKAFIEYWSERYPGQEPASFLLRETLPERWIRFHSLPDSQRYAATETDWQTLYCRHNVLGDAVLGIKGSCWLVVCCHVETTDEEYLPLARFNLKYCFDFRWEEQAGVHRDFPVYAAETVWKNGLFDDLIREIASFRLTNVMLIAKSTGAIFAPYDGGLDLILPSKETVSEFRLGYQEWLPINPSGL